jgi:fatty acid desaturase
MDTPPNEKNLRAVPFVAHATRGVIRDRRARRKMMFALLAIGVLMVIAGSTFLWDLLNPREHLARFAIYWLACAWVTLTSFFLALFDLLAIRAEARAEAKALRERTSRVATNTRSD